MAGYIGSTPVPQGIQEQQSFTATAGQTTFNTLGYTDGNTIRVTLNGVLLEGGGVDYTATNGSDIVLTTAASLDDVLTFETFNEFNLINQNLTTPTFKDSMTMKNDTEEDTDGGRESTLIFKGEQSGGEISTLAEIEASHDGTADDEKGDLIFRTNDGSDGSSPTEAARIDSSQNLLVGKTSPTSTTVGFEARPNGLNVMTRDGDKTLFLNRLTSDGTIVQLYKDGTSVGSIGANGSRAYMAGPQKGIKFGNASADPCTNTGATADNAYDLGGSSVRWKDLYLSGGAYIGGTGSANYLDDYEQGTWTPELTDGSNDVALTGGSGGIYTKIGNVVVVSFDRYNVSISSLSGYLSVKTLPFTPNATGAGSVTTHIAGTSGGANIPITVYPVSGSTSLTLYKAVSATQNVASLSASDLGSNISMRFTLTYFTDS